MLSLMLADTGSLESPVFTRFSFGWLQAQDVKTEIFNLLTFPYSEASTADSTNPATDYSQALIKIAPVLDIDGVPDPFTARFLNKGGLQVGYDFMEVTDEMSFATLTRKSSSIPKNKQDTGRMETVPPVGLSIDVGAFLSGMPVNGAGLLDKTKTTRIAFRMRNEAAEDVLGMLRVTVQLDTGDVIQDEGESCGGSFDVSTFGTSVFESPLSAGAVNAARDGAIYLTGTTLDSTLTNTLGLLGAEIVQLK